MILPDLKTRIADLDTADIARHLDDKGWAVVPRLLDDTQCQALKADYGSDGLYRSTVHKQRHGFGRGEYRYFRYPLPDPVATLRGAFYPILAGIANDWWAAMGRTTLFPADHDSFLAQCALGGQSRPTPLILRYGAGDYNCLHQDIYGEHVFPLQAAVLLSRPGKDFEGGEFVLTEQRPRMQSRAEVVPLGQGDAVVFAVAGRPRAGRRGHHGVTMRHGVATLRAGHRHVLGIIFHDAA